MNESVRIEAVAIAAFTLVTHLLDQLAEQGLISGEQKRQILRRAVEATRARGGETNIDAAALLGLLK